MIAPRNAFLVAALVLTASVDLVAQQEPPVAPGDRVRVTAPTIDRRPLVGTLIALDVDTCALQVEGRADPLALPLASVIMLEVSDQKSGIIIGAVVGGLVGGIAGAVATYASCIMKCSPEEARDDALRRGAGGAVVGAGIGALLGSAIKTDRWEVVPLDRIRLSLTPHGRRKLAVSVSVAF
jgi:hypothetical protein